MYEETKARIGYLNWQKLNCEKRIFLTLELKQGIFKYMNGCAEIARCDCELIYIALQGAWPPVQMYLHGQLLGNTRLACKYLML